MINSPSHSANSTLENFDCRFLPPKTLVVATVINQNMITDFFPMNLISFVLFVQKEKKSRACICDFGKLIAVQMPAKDISFSLLTFSTVTER